MIRVRTLGRRPPALGQAPTEPERVQYLSLCSLMPTQYVPELKRIVARVGCTPASRAALSAAILRQYGGMAQASWYQQMLAAAGPELLADCICQDARYNPPTDDTTTEDEAISPWTIAAIILAAGATVLAVKKAKAGKKEAPGS